MELIGQYTDLYTKYGFEPGWSKEPDKYLVFFSKSGYFQNAEIVIVDPSVSPNSISKSEYEELGYTVRIREFDSIDNIHEDLFRGFFNTKLSNQKLKTEYDAFCKKQNEKLLSSSYEYIKGEYVENGLIKNDVISRICEIFSADERQLVILEASAGYGKTCTSFEFISALIQKFPNKIPLMAELSKNRKASVFRYVLLSEIDQKFPALSSELVSSEIYSGRIFLIIDGFDELLSKSYLSLQEREKSNKDAQTMLDTIAQLFPPDSKTKILLTTRKSSLFVGEDFDEWIIKHLSQCGITRIQLSPPSIRDWIGPEKLSVLESNNIDLNNTLNPVLLSLIRNATLDTIKETFTSNDRIVNQYLSLLLSREQERQALCLSAEEQIAVMSELAAWMVRYDISTEAVEFIKSILSDIINPKLEEYLARYEYSAYAVESKPTEEEFVNKLAHHALLDRISLQDSQIGFINDFIFGEMIVRAILNGVLPPNELLGKFLDIAVTACSSTGADRRELFFEAIRPTLMNETAQRRVNTTLILLNSITEDYDGEYFDGICFNNAMNLSKAKTFKNCFFSDCVFMNCVINTDTFIACQFYNCSFYENTISQGNVVNCELIFTKCEGHEELKSIAYRGQSPIIDAIDFERKILEQFWKPGYDRAEPNRSYHTLLRGFSQTDRQKALGAIESLISKEILIERIRVIELNFEKMNEIREILQR